MQHNQSSNSVVETLSIINRETGLSDNIMAYRLALIMEKNSSVIQPTTTLDPTERENFQSELKTTLSLSKNTQTTEDYRQALKNKYYEEYLQKFGVNKQAQAPLPEQNNSRIENLIAQKKKTFLQQIFESKQRNLPLAPQQNQKISPQPEGRSENNAVSPVGDEITIKSLIPAIMKTVVTMGKDTNTGRIYEGIAYRLQLWMKEGMQLVSVKRKNGTPENAFTAYKEDDSTQFKTGENNLTDEEAQRIINFAQQQDPQPSQTGMIESDDNVELGD